MNVEKAIKEYEKNLVESEKRKKIYKDFLKEYFIGLKQEEIGEILEKDQSVVSKIFSNKLKVSEKYLIKIIKKLKNSKKNS